jgi:hypothetical protein
MGAIIGISSFSKAMENSQAIRNMPDYSNVSNYSNNNDESSEEYVAQMPIVHEHKHSSSI